MNKNRIKKAFDDMNPEIIDAAAKNWCEKCLEKEAKMKTINFRKRIVLIAAAAALVIAAVMIPLAVMMNKAPDPTTDPPVVTNTTGVQTTQTDNTSSESTIVAPKHLYESLVCGSSNDSQYEADVLWWQGYSIREDAEKEKSIVFEGIEYKGTYSLTDTPSSKCYQIDKYSDVSKDVDLYFYSDSGKFAGLHYSDLLTEGYAYKKDLPDAYDYAVEEAKRIAGQFVDVNEYELYVIEKNKANCTLYTIGFYKTIDSFQTSDDITVIITSKGDLRTLRLGDLGIFNDEDVPAIDPDMVNESIGNRLQNMFNIVSPIFSVRKSVLTKTEDGKLTIASEVEVTLKDEIKTLMLIATIIV